MKVKFALTKINEKQFETLFPLKEHSEIILTINDFEQYNRFNSDGEGVGLYVGYFIIDGQFNIIHIPEAKHFGDAAQKAMNSIVLPEINKHYHKGMSSKIAALEALELKVDIDVDGKRLVKQVTPPKQDAVDNAAKE